LHLLWWTNFHSSSQQEFEVYFLSTQLVATF
jgi:hypothetical protein